MPFKTPSTMIQVLEADLSNPKHAAAVLDLLDEYARDPMGGGVGLSDFVQQNLIASLQQRTGSYVWLAFAAEQPVGLLIAFEGFSTFACQPLLNIHDVVVTAAYRGQGIAKQLFAAIEQRAISIGACKLTLEVLAGNTAAQAVYRALGFAGYELAPNAGQAWFWQKTL